MSVVVCRDSTCTASVLKVSGRLEMGRAERRPDRLEERGTARRLASDRDSGSFLTEFVPSLNEAPAREDTRGLLDRLPVRPVQGTGPLETILKVGVTMVHGDFQAKNVLTGITGPVATDPLSRRR